SGAVGARGDLRGPGDLPANVFESGVIQLCERGASAGVRGGIHGYRLPHVFNAVLPMAAELSVDQLHRYRTAVGCLGIGSDEVAIAHLGIPDSGRDAVNEP